MNPQEKSKFNEVAQLSHFAWGMVIILITNLLMGTIKDVAVVFMVWCSYTAAKEFIWDKYQESADVRGSSWEDFIFQVGGAVVAFILILLHNHTW